MYLHGIAPSIYTIISLTLNLFVRIIPLTFVLILAAAPAYGQTEADSLWSFLTIQTDADGDFVLDFQGSEVAITGIVNVDSGLLHENYLQIFVQNDSTGMAIFSMQIDTPVFVGDSITARGTIERYYGLAEVVVESYQVYSNSGEPAPKPLSDAVSDPQAYMGMLVEGEGVITGLGTNFNGKYFMLSPEENNDELMIYVSNFHRMHSNFNFNVLSEGDRVSVKGVITEYSPDYPNERIHQLFLRTPDDIQYLVLPAYYVRMIFGGVILAGILIIIWVLIVRIRVDTETKKIKLSLKQKEILLKEIHHRVKNSLSIVTGLIEIQRSSTENKEAIQVLQDSETRIQSIALIHDKLYKTESLSDIELGYYLKDLAEAIHSTFNGYNDSVILSFDLDKITVDTNRAVYCGLLMNELVVNAFKYAFKKEKQGKLSISLKKHGNDIHLLVSDNGPGLSDNFNPHTNDSLGSMLINSFASNLQAKMEIRENSDGTTFEFRFPYIKNDVPVKLTST